jgi:hypothetical protein
MPKAPRFPYSVKTENKNSILEIPTSTFRVFGKNVPFSGGFYLRLLPEFLIKNAIRNINKEGESAILYLHPREINPQAPKLRLPLRENFIHYWGVFRAKEKFKNILKEFEFESIKKELLPKYLL